MSAPAGWYPDPDPNQPSGSVRYWDGSGWTADTTQGAAEFPETRPVAPQAPRPGQAPQPGWHPLAGTPEPGPWQPQQPQSPTWNQPSEWNQQDWNQAPGWNQQQDWNPGQPAWQQQGPTGNNKAAWIAIGAFALVATMLVVFVVFYLRGRDSTASSSNQSAWQLPTVCWPQQTFAQTQPLGSSTVSAGRLSFTALPSPWGSPIKDTNMVAASETAAQRFVAVKDYQPGRNWYAEASVGAVQVGTADATPEQAAPVLADCMLLTAYGPQDGTKPLADQTANQALTVDGHDAWTIQSTVHPDVEGLSIKNEEFTMVVVQVAPQRLAMYFSSVPDNQPEAADQARGLVGQLKVVG